MTTEPSNQSITYGANATYTAAGAGNPGASVEWQVSTNGGSNWTNLPGAKTEHHPDNHEAERLDSGNQYRAVFTNTCWRHEDRDIERRDVDRRRQGDQG